MQSRESLTEFDADVTRRLVKSDPFLAFTVIHHESESDEHWLKQVFTLDVSHDPGLMSRYRTWVREMRAVKDHAPKPVIDR